MNRNDLSTLGGAQLVRVFGSTVYAWFGGTTINVYATVPDGGLHETTCFNLSDDKGRPEDRETVERHIGTIRREVDNE